jgi:hypothetical protein
MFTVLGQAHGAEVFPPTTASTVKPGGDSGLTAALSSSGEGSQLASQGLDAAMSGKINPNGNTARLRRATTFRENRRLCTPQSGSTRERQVRTITSRRICTFETPALLAARKLRRFD